MLRTFTGPFIRNVIAALRARVNVWRGQRRRESINSLLYIEPDFNSNSVCVYRERDDRMLLKMQSNGNINVFHMGVWPPEEALAIGEALVVLGKGYQDHLNAREVATLIDEMQGGV